MTAHELIVSDIVDRPSAAPVDPVASLVGIGRDADSLIRKFLDTWYPGENEFILSVGGYARMTIALVDGLILFDQTEYTTGQPIIDASVLWSFIATDEAYKS
jgi:hypothetical protein